MSGNETGDTQPDMEETGRIGAESDAGGVSPWPTSEGDGEIAGPQAGAGLSGVLQEQAASGSLTISPMAAYRGRIRVNGDVRIDGVYEGGLETAGKLMIGEQAKVLADLAARDVFVAGAVKGDVAAQTVEILGTGRVWGNITTGSFVHHHGGFVSGQVTMLTDAGPRVLMPEEVPGTPRPLATERLPELTGAGPSEMESGPPVTPLTGREPAIAAGAGPRVESEGPELERVPAPALAHSDRPDRTSTRIGGAVAAEAATPRREPALELGERRRPWAVGVAALVLVVGSAAAFWTIARPRLGRAVVEDRPLTVAEASAGVQARLGPDGAWEPVAAKDILSSGSSVLTGPDSGVVLSMEESDLFVGPDSLLSVLESAAVRDSRAAEPRRVARFLLEKGRVWLQTYGPVDSGDVLEVEWSTGAIAAVSGRCSVYVGPDREAVLSVEKGSAVVTKDDRRVVVQSGSQLQLPSGEAPSAQRVVPMSEQEQALWDGVPAERLLALAPPTMLKPTDTPTVKPLPTNTMTPSATPSPQPSPTRTATATSVPTDTPTATPRPTDTPTATPQPMDTATATPAPTSSPTSTAAPTDTPSPTLAVSSTPTTAAPSPTPVGQGLVVADFEDLGFWQPGGVSPGTLTQTTEQVHDGQYAVKLTYDFTRSIDDFTAFWHTVALQGRPNAFVAWVYGDGTDHYFCVWFVDSQEQSWQTCFGRLDFVGWGQMTAWIGPERGLRWASNGGPNNGVVDYPIRFRALVIDDAPDDAVGSGAVYVDQLVAVEAPEP